ncbi:hypothetical protein ACFQ36_07075 [Arthrobacter sp. GCM10027362]|uniref:hypothetical protein n=1 Tax=Arthrobacter sp. GCM10027362 TaxID=3273379 RepID=UPI0036295780
MTYRTALLRPVTVPVPQTHEEALSVIDTIRSLKPTEPREPILRWLVGGLVDVGAFWSHGVTGPVDDDLLRWACEHRRYPKQASLQFLDSEVTWDEAKAPYEDTTMPLRGGAL